MRVRLQDIAEDLNLSKMTISRVLRGQTDVSAETKERVLQRMQELNYRPNVSARGLRTGQAFRVGVIVPRIRDAYFAALCQGLTTTFQGSSYGVAISVTEGDPETEEREIELHLSRHVDALFLAGPGGGNELPAAQQDGSVPVFYFGRKPAGSSSYGIAYNEIEVGRQPAAYLLSRGARRIAYLRGPRTITADERFSGFLKAHREAGATPRHEWTREARSSANEYRSGYETMAAMLHRRVAPDAVMANTDALAAGARDAALASGYTIPDTFQVIGCGDDRTVCTLGLQLSSVAFSGEDLGMRAARLALKVIANRSGEPIRNVRLNPRIVPRETTREPETGAQRRKGS